MTRHPFILGLFLFLVSLMANAAAPLGINLDSISYWSPEQPFLNIFKTAGPWITHSPTQWDTGEEAYLQLDASGYPTTLVASPADPNSPQLFISVGVLVQREFPATANGYYPAGQYVLLYDGEGTIAFDFDATVVSASAGRYVLNVATPSPAGIGVRIIATDPNHTGNYLRNIRFIKSENESALAAGQMFDPRFVALLTNFKVLRFMDWLATNGNSLSSWLSRPLTSNVFWSSPNGVPVEVAIALSNTAAKDAWVNVPGAADDDYIAQVAVLVHQQLGAQQKAYVELSNEVWNSQFPAYQYAVDQARATWPGQTGSDFTFSRNWYGMRTAQMCDIWKSTWGVDSGRMVCVLAAQAANPWTATQSLDCPYWSGAPCSAHGINAVAIAPYFGGKTPSTWTGDADGGLTSLFASLYAQNDPSIPVGGWLAQASGWEASYITAIAPYGLPVIGYEGGQTFVSFPNGTDAQANLYIAVNRDARMGSAYTTYLQQWQANNGGLFVLFNDIGKYDKYGEWGALESLQETTSPKWAAIQAYAGPVMCSFSISPTMFAAPVGVTSTSVNVVANDPSCYWTGVSNATWITINGQASGTGNGSIAYTVAKNPGGPKKIRTGTMTVAGKTVTITQQ